MFGTMKVVKQLIHAGEGVAVLDGGGIEGTVVNTKAEGAIGFSGKEDRGTILRDARADPTFLKVDLDLFLQLGELGRGHAVKALLWGYGSREEVDALKGSGMGDGGWFIKGRAVLG